mmetsp:Transcript_24166/g.69278  ORF Transcript_24166/g.69278 Transcript_24166/m.69278 type:complete len:259 (+) Transcript_24166:78-854(+)
MARRHCVMRSSMLWLLSWASGATAGMEMLDSMGLVQSSFSQTTVWNQAGGPCQCMGWAEVYRTGMARLGDAREHLPHGSYAAYPDLQENYCVKFNYSSHTVSDFTWCYVSQECASLRGGRRVNSQVSWKVCSPEQDTLFGTLPPGKMVKLIQKSGWMKDPTLIPVMSYPYSTETWSEVAAFYHAEKHEPLSPELQAKMQKLHDTRQPMIICDSLSDYGNGHPDACGPPGSLHLVAGGTVWDFPHWSQPSCSRGCLFGA